MSRVSDPSYLNVIATPIVSLNSLMLQSCSTAVPSTPTTSHHLPVGDLASSFASSLLSCTLPAAAPVISPPPPYHSINHQRSYHKMNPLYDMRDAPTYVETDVDVIGLSKSTREVSICEHDDNQSEKPLDLSLKSTTLYSPTTSRPSVIIESPSGRHPQVRRSASSVSSSREHDVHEHFRRSLSGKWPRRSKAEDEKARASPFTRRTSFTAHGSNCTAQQHVIVSNKGLDIVDHFRRALSEKDFENWQRKRNAVPQTSL